MKLSELAGTVRSKNAGPLKLNTRCLMTKRYTAVPCNPPRSEPGAVARLYGRRKGSVEVLPYPAASAIKIVMDRPVISGDLGNREVYGAQPHAPLLDLEL